MHGFGVVGIVGINPSEALIGDLEVKMHHRGFDTQAQIWIKVGNGIGERNKVAQFQCKFFFISYIPYC
jgi:hypothetical protein